MSCTSLFFSSFRRSIASLAAIAALLAFSPPSVAFQSSDVQVVRGETGWTLTRNGQPYPIRGAGGEGPLELLVACGGNSTRTWGVGDDTRARLDEAQRNGVSVAFGIWLEHERHGFDYSDKAAVQKQFDQVLATVREYKDHPAILVWGIGNEMEGAGENPLIWQHVEELCRAVKKEDPHHPTMTVIAEMGGTKIPDLHRLCPSVDIIGINSYGGAPSVPERYRKLGGKKPYIVTEFGPVGTWEVPRNSIQAIEEPLSGQKTENYRNAYQAFAADRELCLGSYAFLWGHKQEATPTWFGLLLPNNKKLAAVDALTEFWSGQSPANRSPQIERLRLTGPNAVAPEDTLRVELTASDPEQDDLDVRWVLLRDAREYVTGGDRQSVPDDFSGRIQSSDRNGATLKAPLDPGLYRIYAYVEDATGAAVGNLPFRVQSPEMEQPGKKTELPYLLDADQRDAGDFSASGWMGDTDAIAVDENSGDNPKFGPRCIECRFNKNSGWGGVVWLHPENDWGDRPGGLDLSGAKKLTFWARGGDGGEKVKFGFGLLGRDKNFFDTASAEREIELTAEWKQYSFPLEGQDLRRIKSGFFWVVAAQDRPVRFYLDRIAYE